MQSSPKVVRFGSTHGAWKNSQTVTNAQNRALEKRVGRKKVRQALKRGLTSYGITRRDTH